MRTRPSLRPYIVIAGLVLSLSFFTLLGSLLLTALGLPQDLLRWAGIALLAALGIGMIVPRFEQILERPFQRIATFGANRGAARQDRGAFVLGLGVLYVPCAGPVLAAITVAGATGNIGSGTVAGGPRGGAGLHDDVRLSASPAGASSSNVASGVATPLTWRATACRPG